jgi:hypothetical protein
MLITLGRRNADGWVGHPIVIVGTVYNSMYFPKRILVGVTNFPGNRDRSKPPREQDVEVATGFMTSGCRSPRPD